MFFDLALSKTIALNQTYPIEVGDTINYLITITNEGAFDAYDVDVKDHVPTGLTFDATLNPDWEEIINGNTTNIQINIFDPIPASEDTSVIIRLVVNENASSKITNIAEIVAADNNFSGSDPTPIDDDSTPNNNNPAEDDQDSVEVTICSIPSINLTASICLGDLYTLGTQTLTTDGTYSELFQATNGCDSVCPFIA